MKRFCAFGLCVAVVAAVLSGCCCIVNRIPEYQSSIRVYVNNSSLLIGDSVDLSSTDLATSQRLVETYCNIVQSEKVKNAVTEYCGISSGYTIETKVMEGTGVFQILVKSENPQIAYDVACAYAEVVPACLENIIAGSSAKLIDMPTYPQEPSGYRWEFGN